LGAVEVLGSREELPLFLLMPSFISSADEAWGKAAVFFFASFCLWHPVGHCCYHVRIRWRPEMRRRPDMREQRWRPEMRRRPDMRDQRWRPEMRRRPDMTESQAPARGAVFRPLS